MNDIINSAIATFAAEILTLPICTIKTCYQTHDQSNNIRSVIKQIYKDHGVLGFYKASIPAISSQMLSTSSKYFFYKFYEQNLFDETSIKTKIFCGWVSGVTSSIITHPFDFFKIKIQSGLGGNNLSVFDEIKKHGPKIVYRGYSKSFAKVSVGSMLFYPLTDTIQYYINNIIVSSLCSAFISTVIMHPLDYIKIRHVNGNIIYMNSYNLYYKGISLNLLRIVPHFTITMTLIDVLNSRN